MLETRETYYGLQPVTIKHAHTSAASGSFAVMICEASAFVSCARGPEARLVQLKTHESVGRLRGFPGSAAENRRAPSKAEVKQVQSQETGRAQRDLKSPSAPVVCAVVAHEACSLGLALTFSSPVLTTWCSCTTSLLRAWSLW